MQENLTRVINFYDELIHGCMCSIEKLYESLAHAEADGPGNLPTWMDIKEGIEATEEYLEKYLKIRKLAAEQLEMPNGKKYD